MFQDVRLAFRSALKNPALTFVIVVSLALGIGANTTIFTLINAVFLRPLPMTDPARLVQIYTVMPKSTNFQSVSLPNYRDFRDNVRELSGLAAARSINANMVGGTEPLAIGGQLVSGNYFDVLGVHAAHGRTFSPEEDKTPGAAPVMVISDGLWKRAFASDPGIVGKTVTLNGFRFTAIGIMPPGFKGTQVLGSVSFWAPLAMNEQLVTGQLERSFFTTRNSLAFQIVGRMAGDVSLDQARQAMKAMAKRLEEQYPRENEGRSVELFPLTEAALAIGEGRQNFVQSGGVLIAATTLVLLIACGNVASLLLARAMARRREIALRLSVGASRWRLIRQLLAESAVLTVLGGSAGILLAYWGRDLLWSLRPSGMRADFLDLSLEPRVLWYTVGLSVLTGFLFGLIPAIHGSRLDLVSAFKSEAGTPSSGRRTFGLDLRSALVIGQIALSLVALIGAGLFVRSLLEAQRLNPGFRTEGLAVMFVDAGAQGYTPARGRQFHLDMLERIGPLPGVQSASWGEAVPQFSGQAASRRVFPENRELPQELLSLFVPFNGIYPGYFTTVGIPILKGRDFSDADREGAPLVAIINETTAKMFWPGDDPVGKRFKHRLNPDFYTVIGVARDAKYGGIGSVTRPHLYYPALQYYTPGMTLVVRTAGEAEPVVPLLQQVIRQLDPTMPVPAAFTMNDVRWGNMWTARMGAMLLAVFGLLAATLTTVGIYGVMAYSVTRRTKEIGVRMAIGAAHADVMRMVLRQGLKLTALGVGLGLIASLGATRLIANLLFVSPTDGWTFGGISVLLTTVALAASFLPARRAARVDPLVALRHE